MSGPHRIAAPATIDCEVLIVGSGAGGASVADVLTRAGLDVLMVEEGPYVSQDDIPHSASQSIQRLWRGGGLTAALGSTTVAYAEGCCVGGGTEINSAIFQRTPPELLADWAMDYRIDAFGPDELKPYFDRAAKVVNASLTPGPLDDASEILRRGAEKMGWKVSQLELAQRSGADSHLGSRASLSFDKQSMTATLIPAAITRGLRLLAECRVTKLLRRGRRNIGAKAVARGYDGALHSVHINARNVFLCAGAIHTPTLLRRSRITARVGDTLRLHPSLKMVCLFDNEINANLSPHPLYAITEFMPDQRIGGSVFLPGYFGMVLAEDWEQRAWMLPEWRSCGIYYTMARGCGTGSIRVLPGAVEPLVRYRLNETDWHNLAEGVARLGQAMFAAGAKKVYPSISGHQGWSTPQDCREFFDNNLPRERTNLMTIHLFSSCPPGENADRCATDSFGRVHGLENVFIADGSQIPEAPGVNPQGTIMAIAFRNAEAFLADSDRNRSRRAFASDSN